MFCSNCGKEIDDKAVVCVHCGCKTGKIDIAASLKGIFKKPTRPTTIICLIMCVFVIPFYIYLSIPINYSFNFFGMDMEAKIHYEPISTCLFMDINMFGQKMHESTCGISIAKILDLKWSGAVPADYRNLINGGI